MKLLTYKMTADVKSVNIKKRTYYNKKIDDYENVYSLNPLYLVIGNWTY